MKRSILAGAAALAALAPTTALAQGPTGPPGVDPAVPKAMLQAKWNCKGPDTVTVKTQENKSTVTWVKWHIGETLITDQTGTTLTLDEGLYGGTWQRVKARTFFSNGTWNTQFVDAYTCVG